jgi:hypothetical protein
MLVEDFLHGQGDDDFVVTPGARILRGRRMILLLVPLPQANWL